MAQLVTKSENKGKSKQENSSITEAPFYYQIFAYMEMKILFGFFAVTFGEIATTDNLYFGYRNS